MRAGAALLIACVLMTSAAHAQENRQTVFLHGFNANENTWRATADRLRATLNIETHVPPLPWQSTFESQALDVNRRLGHLPADTLAIGHSNGGLAARQWSRLRPLGGVMTIGTPHRGAPAVDRVLHMLGFHEHIYNTAAAVFGALGVQPNAWWDLYVFVELALRYAQGASYSNWAVLAGLGLVSQAPVLPQMSTQSGFLGALNSPANLHRESQAVSARV